MDRKRGLSAGMLREVIKERLTSCKNFSRSPRSHHTLSTGDAQSECLCVLAHCVTASVLGHSLDGHLTCGAQC